MWAGSFLAQILKVKGFNGIFYLDKRLKKIDKRYALQFVGGKFCLMVDYGLYSVKEMDFGAHADARILQKVVMTRKENIASTMQKIDQFNAKMQENALFDVLNTTKDKVREVVNFADKTGKDLSLEQINSMLN